MPDLSTPVINEEADRLLGRIILRHFLLCAALLVLATLGMSFINIDVPQNPLFRYHKPLDLLSILIVLLPFFVGISRLFAARLRLGREFVAGRRWREAVAALDPFAGPGQRFLDGTGEAHFLLAQAYAGMGDAARAEAAQTFLRRHRRGVWADIQTTPAKPGPRIARTTRAAQDDIAGQEKRPRPANRKPRRRF